MVRNIHNNTYREILGFGIPFPFPDKKNYVLTKSLKPDTEFVSFVSDIEPVVEKLKKDQGKDVWLIGGGQINTIFLNRNLVDELLIRIVPMVIGEGLPLFAHKVRETLFELVTLSISENEHLEILTTAFLYTFTSPNA